MHGNHFQNIWSIIFARFHENRAYTHHFLTYSAKKEIDKQAAVKTAAPPKVLRIKMRACDRVAHQGSFLWWSCMRRYRCSCHGCILPVRHTARSGGHKLQATHTLSCILVQFNKEEERITFVHVYIKKICAVRLSNLESRKESQDWLI